MDRSVITNSLFPVELRVRRVPHVLDLEVLGVGFNRPADWPRERAVCVSCGRDAMQWLRMTRFDLVMIDAALHDPLARTFARALRVAHTGQKWALVGSSITSAQEIDARSLGAMVVLDDLPPWKEVEQLFARSRKSTRGPRQPRARPAEVER